MTILTAGACKAVISSAGCGVPAAVGSALGVTLTGVKLLIKNEAVGTAIGGAIGTGTSAGAIAGAVVSKTATSALTGAFVGGLSAAGLGAVVAGSLSGITGLMSAPVGLLCVGVQEDPARQSATYDCWKPVIHDISEDASNGMLLRDLCSHPKIANVTISQGNNSDLPCIVLENVWNERFEIEYLVLNESNKLVCHAKCINK